MNNKLLIFSFIVIFIFGYTLYEANKIQDKLGSTASSTGTIIKQMPSVVFDSYTEENKKIDPKVLATEGNFLFIHFWATWCGPCELEFPDLVELIKLMKDKKNLKFLLVAVNDDKVKIKKFLKKYELTLDNVVLLEDKINAHKEFGTYKMPETFLFNPKNEVVKKFTGQQVWTQKHIVDLFKAL